MMDTSNVTVVIPAFNEAASIGKVVRDLIELIPDIEVIVVNDGSTDDTAREASNSGARVINHAEQTGYGASLCTGIRNSTKDYVLSCDADGQHRASDVKRLIEACDGLDMVVGARTENSHHPLVRRPGKLFLKYFGNLLAGVSIPDLNSGLRIMRRSTISKYLHLMPRGFSFSSTSTFAIIKGYHRYTYIPITVDKRVGHSTVRQLRHGPVTLMLLLRLAVLFEPLKIFLAVSAFLLVLTLISLGIDMGHGTGLADTTVILSIATLLIFLSGLLCDQVSAIRREMHG